jgi:hypothetical protein
MQAMASCHWPLMLQVCGVSGEAGLHRGASPGVHTQQSPPVHPSGQLVDGPQCPLGSHAWLVCASAHFLAGATQSLQSLLVQAAQVTGLLQLPVALQVSKVVGLLQRVLFGAQSTQ